MESQYSVSVIMPVHNTAPYLRRCIESVRNQTLKDIEIILVDNLSTDDSPSICNEYANIDSRVKVLHLDEAGLSIARNAGIEIAMIILNRQCMKTCCQSWYRTKFIWYIATFALSMKMAV